MKEGLPWGRMSEDDILNGDSASDNGRQASQGDNCTRMTASQPRGDDEKLAK